MKRFILFIFFILFTFSFAIAQNWTQLGQGIDGEAASDLSGHSVSLSSDGLTVAIGAPYNDGNGNSAGHVRVYKNISGTWIQQGIDLDGAVTDDMSGWSVSLSSDGQILAIGAKNNDDNGSNAGHVRIYNWNGTSWIQQGADIDGEAAGDQSGLSVSLSSDGQTVAIGAPYNDGNGTSAGHLRIYNWSGTSWNQFGQDIDGEAANDLSDWSLSLSSDGQTVAIGAYLNDGNGSDAGHVRIYQYNGLSWVQLGGDIDGEAAGDRSGWSVALSADGQTVAIGAYGNDGNGSNAGHVRIYNWTGTSWNQLGQDIDGEVSGDNSGNSVALSSDGGIVAIGARYNDGNGSNAGHVRVYNYNGSSWTQVGSDIDGQTAGDWSGYSVALSSDGQIVAIGANWYDGIGISSGHVRLFSSIVPVYGCTDTLACNYDALANMDDGSCYGLLGCIDPIANNYDVLACFDDGSCTYNYGCTDSTAVNYDPSATMDDGSCIYCSSSAIVLFNYT
ncbi:MAG: hypothetical protein VYB55_01585, partial [Bacteroidota bacterium]|nr:hypothetical protein [Bacteroidota bacterium]